jgi:diaminopimelate decarboxylase
MDYHALAHHYPTPFFAYDAAVIRSRAGELVDAFSGQRVSLHYAVKANDHPAIIAIAAAAGIGACLVTGGELQRAQAGGVPPERMLMNGVGKSRAEIRQALQAGIGQLNVESLPELTVIAEVASELGIRARIGLRINPEIVAKAHTHTTVARRTDKFGLLIEDMPAARAIIAAHPALDWRGLSCHIGSQIHGVDELVESYRVMVELFRTERRAQPQFDRLDLGGGFGVSYTGDTYARPADYAGVIGDITGDLQASGVTIQLEPGRFLVAEAGALITQVLYVKDSGHGENGTRFIVVDAAMNNLIRPALYDAYHPITLARPSTAETVPCTIVGPVCESADRFARGRDLPADIVAGDILVIGCAGAYGNTMASQYNARDKLAEVLVDGDSHKTIRRAMTATEYDALTVVG